jgi:hypothetical protein
VAKDHWEWLLALTSEIMAKWTQKLITQQLEWTNVCFDRALLDVYGHQLDEREKKLSGTRLKLAIAQKNNENLIAAHALNRTVLQSPAVNEAYLHHIRQLPTEQIELIVEAYQKGKQTRSYSTIDVLMSELFERATKQVRLT